MNNKQLLRTIEKAKKNGVTKLDLSGQSLTELPPEIGQLTHLVTLDLQWNHISRLPSEIGKLINLTTLDLWSNRLETLPPEIGQLTHLTNLDLTGNKLNTLPPEISQLTRLTALNLSWNQFHSLPPEIGQLTRLTTLDLRNNKLTKLPPEISELANLTKLEIQWNQLHSLPLEIGKLSHLTRLDLSNNELSRLPLEIGQLTNLTELYLSDNQLSRLPFEIGQLTNLTELYLSGNRLPIPPEILSRADDPATIIRYYRAGHRKSLNEAKLMCVGQSGVGKTSLIKQLVEDQFDEPKRITEDIAIKEWVITVDETEIKLNIWDFGGRESRYITHQFFITKRTLYLLVLDAQNRQVESQLDYWLSLIQDFGQGSPIIVVSNKSDLHQFVLNQEELQKKYPTIKAFVHTSCRTGEGTSELRQYVTDMITRLKHVQDKIPITWLEIKAELEQSKQNYILYRDYVQLCQAKQINQVKQQRLLMNLLHDLGVVLNFQDDITLSETIILNSGWITDAVYKIINAEQVEQNRAILEIDQLHEILDDHEMYPEEIYLFVMNLMQRMAICFEFEGSSEKKFLIPDLLPKKESISSLNWPVNSLKFEFHYNFLSSHIIPRFITQMKDLIENKTDWHYGMILAYNKNRALIKAIPKHNKIHISIVGPLKGRLQLLRSIYEQFNVIHQTIQRLNLHTKNLDPQFKHPLLGNIGQKGVSSEPITQEQMMDFNDRLENIELLAHPQEYYPVVFWFGQLCYEELEDYKLALKALVKADQAISMWRGLMREQTDEKHKQLSEECVSVYEMLVHCYLVEADKEQAFQYAAIGKGRAFVNTLTRSRFDFDNVLGEQADFLKKLEKIRQVRSKIENFDNNDNLDKQEQYVKQDVLLREEAEFWREIEREYPLLTATLTVPTLSVEQAGLLAQDLDATLVEYYRHAKEWCAFVVSVDEKGRTFVRYVPLPKLNNNLLVKLVRWRNDLRLSNGRSKFRDRRLSNLYEAAIVPLALKSERVIIAPFEQLHLLPLSAAYDGKKYLSEKHTLSFVPSLTALYVVHQERKLHKLAYNHVQRFLSVAYPGRPGYYLPNVLAEANAIVERLEGVATSKKLHQTEATPENVIRDASGYDIIHFGCHGRFDMQEPQESGLRLAGKMVDGQASGAVRGRNDTEALNESYLTVQRIITELNLKRTRLATLAACLTGEVKLQQGEEHVGLLQAMMAAGVQTVVASLWHVDDAATRFLFEAFYLQEAYLQSSSQAMRYASDFLRQQEKWRHPYYWAAFQVNGFPPLPKKRVPLAWPADLQHNIQKDTPQRRVRSMMHDKDIIRNAEILLDTMLEFSDEIRPALRGAPISEQIRQQQTDTSPLNIAKALHYIVEDNPILRKMFDSANVGQIRVSETQDKDEMTRTSRQAQKKAKQVSNIVLDDVGDKLNRFLIEEDPSLAGQDNEPSLLDRFIRRINSGRKR